MSTDKLETAPAESVAPADADKANESFILDFKSREEAEKGFKEVQAAKTRAEQRAAELEKQAEELRLKALVSQQINEQARLNAAAQGTSVSEERSKLKSKWNEKLTSDDPAEVVLEGMERVASAYQRELEERESKLKKELEGLTAKMAEMEVRQSPKYQQNAQQIDILAKKLGSTKAAMELFDELAATATLSFPAAPPPGGTVQSRSASTGSSAKYRPLTEDEKRSRRAMGWTEEEIAADKVAI